MSRTLNCLNCLEVMGEYCTLPVDYKQTAQMNLMQLLAGAVPHPPNIEVSSLTNLSPDQVCLSYSTLWHRLRWSQAAYAQTKFEHMRILTAYFMNHKKLRFSKIQWNDASDTRISRLEFHMFRSACIETSLNNIQPISSKMSPNMFLQATVFQFVGCRLKNCWYFFE